MSVNRRTLLRRCGLLASGMAASLLVSCRGSEPPSATVAPEAPATATVPPLAVATATPPPATEPAATVPAAEEAPPTVTVAPATPAPAEAAYMAVARGTSPAAITEAAIKAIGGIERFVKPGDNVIVKPNICVAYHGPEYAATTNPEVVGTIVRLCKGAGAGRVRVMDYPFGGTARDAYAISGIQAATEAAGGEMELMSRVKYAEVDFPEESRDIRRWQVYQDALTADVLINVPIAKHHGNSTLTLGAKNLMGLIENRGVIHVNLHQRIADLVTLFRPSLTVMDAVRTLQAYGPSGGDLSYVKEENTVIASHDIVAVDAYTTGLFDFADLDKVAYIRLAAEMGMGTIDLDGVRIEEISV